MKKYILLSLSAFILACLIGGGIVWRLETKGKIKFKWNPDADNQALTLDRLIRELIPGSGQIYGKWDVLARQEDPVDWEYEDSQGYHINPRIGSVKLVGEDNKPIPGHWDILLNKYWKNGYKLFGISHDSIFDIDPQVFPIKLQEGEQAELLPLKKGQRLPFVNKKAHYELYSVQLKDKAPAQLLIEWPGENNGHTFSIYGEASAVEELWDPDDDIFEYKDLKNRNKQIVQLPLFSKGDWFEWYWNDLANYLDFGCLRMSRHFIIEKNGTITNLTNPDDIYKYTEDYQEAFFYMKKNMPLWKPGKIKGKPVRVRFYF